MPHAGGRAHQSSGGFCMAGFEQTDLSAIEACEEGGPFGPMARLDLLESVEGQGAQFGVG